MGPEDSVYIEITFKSLLYSQRAKASVLELQIQNKLCIYHTVVICSVCVKGVEMNVAVPLLMKLGKCFLQC